LDSSRLTGTTPCWSRRSGWSTPSPLGPPEAHFRAYSIQWQYTIDPPRWPA
jgi:hypothetical protein